MGCFSWKFSDASGGRKRLVIGEPAYVACPDGTFIYESAYDGYGNFGGYDIYELVADWNRELVDESMLRPCLRSNYAKGVEEDKWYIQGMKHYVQSVLRLRDWREHLLSDEEMAEKYGKEWKREIGIDIACYNDQNRKLPYPIKITQGTSTPYAELRPSRDDPRQGCF